MKKIRVLSIFSVILFFLIIIMMYFGCLSWDIVIYGAFLSALVSISVSLPLEYLNFDSEQKSNLNNFFWEGVNPYFENLTELFLYARDLYYLDYIFLDIPKDETNWEKYKNVYLKYDTKLNEKLDAYIHEIYFKGGKYKTIVSTLSSMLENIERLSIFCKVRNEYEKAYTIYNIIENINCHLSNAYDRTIVIRNIEDDIQRRCESIILCRYLSEKLCVDYNANIQDVEEGENNENHNNLAAMNDLNKAMNDFISLLK
ncbi:hypothetical protein [uncultured Anaerococcus sp.]|uniref:hypothetical protein n=1 Tax=uncultured Anaerococcus sp. TaxID=293428 RepID=UPI00288953F7|nr:hypothetical protein [uncultured Anaerococcus sp.]